MASPLPMSLCRVADRKKWLYAGGGPAVATVALGGIAVKLPGGRLTTSGCGSERAKVLPPSRCNSMMSKKSMSQAQQYRGWNWVQCRYFGTNNARKKYETQWMVNLRLKNQVHRDRSGVSLILHFPDQHPQIDSLSLKAS